MNRLPATIRSPRFTVMALAGMLACGGADLVVIQDVNVVDVETGTVLPSMNIVLSGNRIREIGPVDDVNVPRGATVIDGAGSFAIPGLWDMHVHVLQDSLYQRAFPMLIGNGVTGVRDMNGPMPLDSIQALRVQVAGGEVLGPRFVAPGPLLDGPGRGPDALGPMVRWVGTPAAARDSVRSLAAQGADFIKPYNRLTPDLFDAILDEAAQVGIPVMGHVPLLVDPLHASEAGLRSMEHLQGVLEAASTGGAALLSATARYIDMMAAGEQPGAAEIQAVLDGRRGIAGTQDSTLAAGLADAFVRNGTWQCVTLTSNRVVHFLDFEDTLREDPRLRFVSPAARDSWAETSYLRSFGGADEAWVRQRWNDILSLVRTLHRRGVRMLVGTDTGVPYTYPGFSLHDELGLLVEAGLSPGEALRAATLGPAEFLGAADSLGTLEAGKVADLVLLEANPLIDIANTRRIRLVVVNGRVLDRSDLDALLAEAEARAETPDA